MPQGPIFGGEGQASTGTGGGVNIQDEGTALSTTATVLNFEGAGVTATGAGATKVITIPGGGVTSLEDYQVDVLTIWLGSADSIERFDALDHGDTLSFRRGSRAEVTATVVFAYRQERRATLGMQAGQNIDTRFGLTNASILNSSLQEIVQPTSLVATAADVSTTGESHIAENVAAAGLETFRELDRRVQEELEPFSADVMDFIVSHSHINNFDAIVPGSTIFVGSNLGYTLPVKVLHASRIGLVGHILFEAAQGIDNYLAASSSSQSLRTGAISNALIAHITNPVTTTITDSTTAGDYRIEYNVPAAGVQAFRELNDQFINWDPYETYANGDQVAYSEKLYIANKAITGNANNDDPGTATSDWDPAGRASVTTDATITGNGVGTALSVANPFTAADESHLDAVPPEWVAATTYASGDQVLLGGKLYIANKTIVGSATNDNPVTATSDWDPAGSGSGGGGLSSVETDATITGDGTSGSALSVANPFTALQEAHLEALPPQWNATATYSMGDQVSHGDKIYISQANTNLNNNPASDNVNWTPVGTGGSASLPTSLDGIPVPAWAMGSSYAVGELVRDTHHRLFMCYTAIATSNIAPAGDPIHFEAVESYQGAYADSTAYPVGAVVTHSSNVYFVITAVASSNTTDPTTNTSFVQINGGGGTTVEANPSGATDSGDLTKVSIGGSIYDVPAGELTLSDLVENVTLNGSTAVTGPAFSELTDVVWMAFNYTRASQANVRFNTMVRKVDIDVAVGSAYRLQGQGAGGAYFLLYNVSDELTFSIADGTSSYPTCEVDIYNIETRAGTGGITEVLTDTTITGDGTSGNALAVANPFTAADESHLDAVPAVWAALTTYADNAQVVYSGKLYIANKAITGNAANDNPATATSDWDESGSGSGGGGLSSVETDATITGDGTSGSALGVANPFTQAQENHLESLPPLWNPTSTYGVGDQVSASDKLYISQAASNQGNDPTSDNTNWSSVGTGGAASLPTSLDGIPVPAWATGNSYVVGELVRDPHHRLFMCYTAITTSSTTPAQDGAHFIAVDSYQGAYADTTAYPVGAIVTHSSNVYFVITAVGATNTDDPTANNAFVQINGGGGSSGTDGIFRFELIGSESINFVSTPSDSPLALNKWVDSGIDLPATVADGETWAIRIAATLSTSEEYKLFPASALTSLPDAVIGAAYDADTTNLTLSAQSMQLSFVLGNTITTFAFSKDTNGNILVSAETSSFDPSPLELFRVIGASGGSGGGLSTVATDATISGDGSMADPLVVANPFTADDESHLDAVPPEWANGNRDAGDQVVFDGFIYRAKQAITTTGLQSPPNDTTNWEQVGKVNLSLGTRTGTTVPLNVDSGSGVTLPQATSSLAGLLTAGNANLLASIPPVWAGTTTTYPAGSQVAWTGKFYRATSDVSSSSSNSDPSSDTTNWDELSSDADLTALVYNWALQANPASLVPANKIDAAIARDAEVTQRISGLLNQTQVDARVVAGVLAWAQTGNSDALPDNKIPAGIARDAEVTTRIANFRTEAQINTIVATALAGYTEWEQDWVLTSAYAIGAIVRHTHGTQYATYLCHTATVANLATTEPGVGNAWASTWYRLGYSTGDPQSFVGASLTGQDLTLTRASGSNPLVVDLSGLADSGGSLPFATEIGRGTPAVSSATIATDTGINIPDEVADDEWWGIRLLGTDELQLRIFPASQITGASNVEFSNLLSPNISDGLVFEHRTLDSPGLVAFGRTAAGDITIGVLDVATTPAAMVVVLYRINAGGGSSEISSGVTDTTRAERITFQAVSPIGPSAVVTECSPLATNPLSVVHPSGGSNQILSNVSGNDFTIAAGQYLFVGDGTATGGNTQRTLELQIRDASDDSVIHASTNEFVAGSTNTHAEVLGTLNLEVDTTVNIAFNSVRNNVGLAVNWTLTLLRWGSDSGSFGTRTVGEAEFDLDGTAQEIALQDSGGDAIVCPSENVYLIARLYVDTLDLRGSVVWIWSPDLRAAIAGNAATLPAGLYTNTDNEIFFHSSGVTPAVTSTGNRIVIEQVVAHTAPVTAVRPSISSFVVTGERSPEAGDLSGDTYDCTWAIAQAGHVDSARIIGYIGTSDARPTTVSVLANNAAIVAASYASGEVRVQLPASTTLTANQHYTIELQVYAAGEMVGTPTIYHDYVITARAAATAVVHFGLVPETGTGSRNADINFDNDISTATSAAGTYNTGTIAEGTEYNLYWAVPATFDQPTVWTHGGQNVTHIIAAAVDITVSSVTYKLYRTTTAFDDLGSNQAYVVS